MCAEAAELGGSVHSRMIISRGAVHVPTVHVCTHDAFCVALVTGHGSPPTVTVLSAAVSEKPWPVSVSISPGLAAAGEVDSSNGVLASSTLKLQPPATLQTAPSTATSSVLNSTTGGETGGGGGESAGAAGDGQEGGKKGGTLGGGGGNDGGGEGARRTEQSSQS